MHKTKDYERFLEFYKEKKYALAFALGIKYPSLQNTLQYIAMEKNFQTYFENAQKLLLLNLRDKAKKQLSKYKTVISKQKFLQLITNKDSKFREFLLSYEENDFKSCYEIMDKYQDIRLVKISILLENHWNKLIKKCEAFKNNGNISAIINLMDSLLLTSTRSHTIRTLLSSSFIVKIEKLLDLKNFDSAEAIIYSYIDIFGEDKNLKKLKKEFEKLSQKSLAITNLKQKIDKDYWMSSYIIKCFDS